MLNILAKLLIKEVPFKFSYLENCKFSFCFILPWMKNKSGKGMLGLVGQFDGCQVPGVGQGGSGSV